MNLIERVILNSIRKPSKIVILFLLVFLLGTFFCIAISVRNAIYQTEARLREKLLPVVTLQSDLEEFGHSEDGVTHFEFPTVDMIEAVADLPYVRNYDFRSSSQLYNRNLESVVPPVDQESLPQNVTIEEYLEHMPTDYKNIGGYVGLLPVIGVNSSMPVDLQLESISLLSGRFMTQEEIDNGANVAVISSIFANVNNLQVGSTISLENNVYDNEAIAEQTSFSEGIMLFPLYWHLDEFILAQQVIEFEVIGIFEVEREFIFSESAERTLGMAMHSHMFHNQIYVPHRTQEELARFIMQNLPDYFWEQATIDNPLTIQPTFVLYDSRDFNDLARAANEILPQHWHVADTSGAYAPIQSSMDTMLWISDLIFWGALIMTIAVLSLLLMLFLRERRHEIGIYRALGESKGKIISQILIEVSVVSISALILALFAGNVLTNKISTQMLHRELINQEQEGAFDGFSEDIPFELFLFDLGPMSVEDMIDAYDASMNISSIIFFFTVQIIVISFSTIAPISYVMRLDPKKILL